jgi:hypothetical protein
MLFKPHREMNQDLWDQLPDTTNAEEAMHWKLYCDVGKDLPCLKVWKVFLSFPSTGKKKVLLQVLESPHIIASLSLGRLWHSELVEPNPVETRLMLSILTKSLMVVHQTQPKSYLGSLAKQGRGKLISH